MLALATSLPKISTGLTAVKNGVPDGRRDGSDARAPPRVLFRPRKQILRMGVDSLVVLLVWIASVGGLFAIAGGGGAG